MVSTCVRAGIDQFLDLDSGVPTVGNVHEIAHQLDPAARVAYVDVEPVTAAQARELLHRHHSVSVTLVDLRDATAVLAGASEGPRPRPTGRRPRGRGPALPAR